MHSAMLAFELVLIFVLYHGFRMIFLILTKIAKTDSIWLGHGR